MENALARRYRCVRPDGVGWLLLAQAILILWD